MNSFGKYAIIDPVTYHLNLEPGLFWKIKPPTAGDELSLRRFMSAGRVETSPMGIRREYYPNLFEQAHREVALTFAGTNIPLEAEKPVADGGEPFIKVGASVEEIEMKLNQMPHELVMELWDEVGRVVPGWGPVTSPNLPSSAEKPKI